MKNIFKIVLTTLALMPAIVYGITPNQIDNFQNGTVQNWATGALNPNPPTILTGGFGGAADKFLRVTSNGGLTAGGKLVFFNDIQWTGDYVGANITSISMRVRNSGASPLLLRVAFNGPAGFFCTADPIHLNSGGTWQIITFPIQTTNLTGTGAASSTMAGVTEMRILHNSVADYHGEPVAGQLDIDDISANSNIQSVNDGTSIPKSFELKQNYPNPFNPGTIISYSVASQTMVSLSVYSITGKEIETLVNEVKNPGLYSVYFDASALKLSSGIYFYQLHAGNYSVTKKFTLLK